VAEVALIMGVGASVMFAAASEIEIRPDDASHIMYGDFITFD
jgi:hypothetical protein